MVSLWGSDGNKDKRDDEEDIEGEEAASDRPQSSQRARDVRAADERQPLLPPPRRDGYLDPDDPAVCSSRLHTDR